MRYILSLHARQELMNRRIPLHILESVFEHPQQVVDADYERHIYQSKVEITPGKVHLLRAVVEDDKDPAIVVTVYKTSKINKYWRVP